MQESTQQENQRLEKLADIREEGINPYPNNYPITCPVASLVSRYIDFSEDRLKETGPVKAAGRIVSLRGHGKTCFLHLQGSDSVKLQVYLRKDSLGENYTLIKKCDIGDFIGVAGELFRTRTGELTVHARELVFLSKSLRPLPEKWHGLKDIEIRYRQRYLDLIANPKSVEIFITRSRVIQFIRAFLNDREFLEVETPMMHPIPGGAAARPFITHHNTLDIDLYLRIAPELYLKRLIVGGFERVYEINRNFRNEGISTEHNPEFTMIEFYQAYADYHQLMDMTEELIRSLAREVLGTSAVDYQGHRIDFGAPWKRIGLKEAIVERDRTINLVDLDRAEKLEALARRLEIPLEKKSPGKLLMEIFEKLVEPHLMQPTFVIDFPTEVSPLSKSKPDDPGTVERFELYVAGFELANAFSELNDPAEQQARFASQMAERESGDDEAHQMDEDYITALAYGMPPTAGEGIGIDRLVMILTNSPSIRDVILFPQLRRQIQ
ncbi:MAG: lysine--tRNA ligase [bacterium]